MIALRLQHEHIPDACPSIPRITDIALEMGTHRVWEYCPIGVRPLYPNLFRIYHAYKSDSLTQCHNYVILNFQVEMTFCMLDGRFGSFPLVEVRFVLAQRPFETG